MDSVHRAQKIQSHQSPFSVTFLCAKTRRTASDLAELRLGSRILRRGTPKLIETFRLRSQWTPQQGIAASFRKYLSIIRVIRLDFLAMGPPNGYGFTCKRTTPRHISSWRNISGAWQVQTRVGRPRRIPHFSVGAT